MIVMILGFVIFPVSFGAPAFVGTISRFRYNEMTIIGKYDNNWVILDGSFVC